MRYLNLGAKISRIDKCELNARKPYQRARHEGQARYRILPLELA